MQPEDSGPAPRPRVASTPHTVVLLLALVVTLPLLVPGILAGAMLLRHGLRLEAEAVAIERAVESVLNAGHRTADLARGGKSIGTVEMGRLVVEALSMQTS